MEHTVHLVDTLAIRSFKNTTPCTVYRLVSKDSRVVVFYLVLPHILDNLADLGLDGV